MFPLLRLHLVFCFDISSSRNQRSILFVLLVIEHEMDTGTDNDGNSIVGFDAACLAIFPGSDFADYENWAANQL